MRIEKLSKHIKIASTLVLITVLLEVQSMSVKAGFSDLVDSEDNILDEVEYDKEVIEDGKYDITQAQITKRYTLNEYLNESRNSKLKYGSLLLGACNEVTGHETDEQGNTTDIHCDNESFTLIDTDLAASVINSIITDKLFADKDGFKQRQPIFQYTRPELESGFKEFSIDNYSFMLYRGQDEITLSKYEYNETDETDGIDTKRGDTKLLALMDSRMGYKPSGTRKDNGDYKQTLQINLKKEQSSNNDYITKSKRDCGHGGELADEATVESEGIDDKEITIGVYKGKKSSAKCLSVGEKGNLKLNVRGRELSGVHGRGVLQSKIVAFYPWVKMFYHEYTNEDKMSSDCTEYEVKNTTVLGGYMRGIIPTSYAEAGYWKSSDVNVNLTSNMWNINHNSLDKHGYDSINSGSTLELNTKGFETRVYLTTWQFIIADGKNREAIEEVSGPIYSDYNDSKAKEKHREYVEEALKVLDGYRMVLWVNKDDTTNDIQAGGVRVSKPSTDIRVLNNKSAFSSDDKKYYLSPDTGASASDGDLDVREGTTDIEYYKILSNTSGDIILAKSESIGSLKAVKGNGNNGKIILTRKQKISDLSDSEAIEINERTKLISNFVLAISRNKGKDKSKEVTWVNDGRWYNEAFEIYMVKQVTDIELGLIKPSIRTTIIDPKLSPLNTGKDTNHTKWLSAQYKLNNITDATDLKNKTGYTVSTFDGKEVKMPDIENLFKTKIFYISNVTSQESG